MSRRAGSRPRVTTPCGCSCTPTDRRHRQGHPPELRDPTFSSAVRGYDRHEVDRYVERVNGLIAELQISGSPRAAVRHALDRVGEQTSGILQRARERIAARQEEAEARMGALEGDIAEVSEARRRVLDDAKELVATLSQVISAAEAANGEPSDEQPDEGPPSG